MIGTFDQIAGLPLPLLRRSRCAGRNFQFPSSGQVSYFQAHVLGALRLSHCACNIVRIKLEICVATRQNSYVEFRKAQQFETGVHLCKANLNKKPAEKYEPTKKPVSYLWLDIRWVSGTFHWPHPSGFRRPVFGFIDAGSCIHEKGHRKMIDATK